VTLWPPLLSSRSPRVRHGCPARAGRRTGTAFWVGNDTSFGPLRATFLRARLATRPRATSGGFSAAPGRRTVAAALRAMGLEGERTFHRYHRVLSRATWSSREASCALLRLLVEAFVPDGPLVTKERATSLEALLQRTRQVFMLPSSLILSPGPPPPELLSCPESR
jgi:DDE superfamily endonuclease